MITHTISILELSWTIVALLGLGFICALLRRAEGDYRFLMQLHLNGLRKYAALTSVLIFLGGTITQLSYVAVGVVAMTQPSLHNHITEANVATAAIFLTGSVVSVVFAILIYYRRVKIVDMLAEKEREHAITNSENVTPGEPVS